jgi:hypothetical protein
MEEKIKSLEKKIKILERQNKIMMDRIDDQAQLLISIGKKVLKMSSDIKEMDRNSCLKSSINSSVF